MSGRRSHSRLRVADTLRESSLELRRRPGRAAVTAMGVALGVTVIVATLVLVATIRFQVSDEFDALLATQVELRLAAKLAAGVAPSGGDEEQEPLFPPPAAAVERLAALSGVQGVAVVRETFSEERVALNRIADPSAAPAVAPVRAVSVHAFDVLETRVSGPGWNRWHEDRAERVAVLGRQTADELGVREVIPGDQAFINGISFTLVGILEDAPRLPALRSGLLVPLTTGAMFAMNSDRDRIIVVTASGAADQVAEVLALALSPTAPGRWTAYAPAADDTLRRAVDSQLEILSLALGGVVLLLGVVSIGNAALSSVLQRIHEIGLRRALGARRIHIAAHIVLDAALIGAIGGVVGATLGLTAALAVTAWQGWQPVIDTRIPAGAVAVGVLAGALAGIYPARVGSRLQPTEALRRE